MLHEFLSANRTELIRRCRFKVGQRSSPPVTASELEYGVPLFLGQLVEALRCEQNPASPSRISASAESSRAAALHGKKLLEQGYTVDQVVHDYGDICPVDHRAGKGKSCAGHRRRVSDPESPARHGHFECRRLVRTSPRRVARGARASGVARAHGHARRRAAQGPGPSAEGSSTDRFPKYASLQACPGRRSPEVGPTPMDADPAGSAG